jgi:hypothetical protein
LPYQLDRPPDQHQAAFRGANDRATAILGSIEDEAARRAGKVEAVHSFRSRLSSNALHRAEAEGVRFVVR